MPKKTPPPPPFLLIFRYFLLPEFNRTSLFINFSSRIMNHRPKQKHKCSASTLRSLRACIFGANFPPKIVLHNTHVVLPVQAYCSSENLRSPVYFEPLPFIKIFRNYPLPPFILTPLPPFILTPPPRYLIPEC